MMLTKKGRSKMKLKSIRIYGFKSFADKTEIDFKTNITAIVGPNGSGKSNIVDAIRWVLGEQSIKSLRGSNSMSDVIFKGSETRKPCKRCEVALIFDNESAFLNTDLTEVEIKRVLYASGENEYFINNNKVRLKDLTTILLDSGVGGDSFNIISQGHIENIINSKPIDRRILIEGAAQVLKYKTRKNESLRKLEKTEDNLDKVSLIINELEQSVLPLKEQSKVANEYLALEKELHNLEISLTVADLTSINEKYEATSKTLQTLQDDITAFKSQNTAKETDIQKLEAESLLVENKLDDENTKFWHLNEKYNKLQNERTILEERQRLEPKKAQIDKTVLALKEEESHLEKELALQSATINTQTTKLHELEKELASEDEKSALIKIEAAKVKQDIAKNMREEMVLKNRLTILEGTLENDSNLSPAIKNVLNNPRLKGIHNVIGRLISTEDTYRLAIEMALSSAANFLVVDSSKDAQKAIAFLKENKLGRVTFFPLDVILGRSLPASVLEEAKRCPGFINTANNLVTFDTKYQSIIENQLGQVLVVKDFKALEELGEKTMHRYRIVSLEGEISHVGGSITGGYNKKTTSYLEVKADISECQKKLATIKQNLTILEKKDLTLTAELQNLATLTEEKRTSKNILAATINEEERMLASLKDKIAQNALLIEAQVSFKEGNTDNKLLGIIEALKQVDIDKELTNQKINEFKTRKSEIASQIAALENENKKFLNKVRDQEQKMKACEIDLGKMETRMDYLLTLLSETYHMTYEKAAQEYILDLEIDLARQKVNTIKRKMKELEPVNLGSIKEYERVNTRYEFLTNQKEDLLKATEDLRTIISEMDEIMEERLKDAFQKISTEFSVVFHQLFKGGNGKLILTDPNNLLETGIDIVAEPPGKKLNNIQLLSGGEKTLTAIALLFAILNVYPVPFCVLDEVEAALDEANVDTFGKYLLAKKEKSEYILITHKKRTMEYADTLYGITMQEQGVSKVVSVKLEGVKTN